jgi:hypothetical protein
MAKNSLQDKFQTSYPYKEEDNEGKTWQWAKNGTLKPSLVSGGYSSNSIAHDFQAKGNRSIPYVSEVAARNGPPTWTDIQEATMRQNGGMKMSTAGATDVTNASNKKALKDGWTMHDMDSVDDEYTGANQDHFYGEAIGPDDGGNEVVGFVERNNYLDRL